MPHPTARGRPRISVGLPVYNGAATLVPVLEALLGQDFRDFELIICDNASEDATESICQDFARRDGRIRYLRRDSNVGAARNYNDLVGQARGDFFRWASHDDLVAPNYLSSCLEAFVREPDAVLCYPRTIIIDGAGREQARYEDGVQALQERPSERLSVFLRKLGLCNSVFGLMRLNMLRNTRLIDSFRSSDVVLLSEIALAGKVVEVPDYLFSRRRDPESNSPANMSPAEQAAWFDPEASWAHPYVRTTLIAAHVGSILRLPVGWSERLRCLWVLTRDWGPRYWRVVAGEFKLGIKRRLGVDRAGGHRLMSKQRAAQVSADCSTDTNADSMPRKAG